MSRRADGVRVPISQVATVAETHKEREVQSRLDGRDAVELEVYKAADANVVHLAEAVRLRLGVGDLPEPEMGEGMPGERGPPTLKERLPDGVTMVVLEDQAQFIEASISNLRSTAVLGALLAIIS